MADEKLLTIEEAMIALSKDMHQASTRPCRSCRDVSRALGKNFGCYEKRHNFGDINPDFTVKPIKPTKVINIGKKINNSFFTSPMQALQDSVKRIETKDGAFAGNKYVLVLALDRGEDENEYSVSFVQAGMRMSDCAMLCEIAKSVFMEEMGY